MGWVGLVGVRGVEGQARPRLSQGLCRKDKGKLVLSPCPKADLARPIWGGSLKGVKVLVPMNLGFLPEETSYQPQGH